MNQKYTYFCPIGKKIHFLVCYRILVTRFMCHDMKKVENLWLMVLLKTNVQASFETCRRSLLRRTHKSLFPTMLWFLHTLNFEYHNLYWFCTRLAQRSFFSKKGLLIPHLCPLGQETKLSAKTKCGITFSMRREEEIILLVCASLQTITFRSSILHQSL